MHFEAIDPAIAPFYKEILRVTNLSLVPPYQIALMATPVDIVAATTGSWTARPGCHEHLRVALERAVNSAPVAWRVIPVAGEVFPTKSEAENRLRIWSLVKGFAVVRDGGGNKRYPAALYKCIHYGHSTRNN